MIFKKLFKTKSIIFLIPILMLLLTSMISCKCKTTDKSETRGTIFLDHGEPRNTAITLYLQPYNDFPEKQIAKLHQEVQYCLDTLIPKRKFVVKVRKNLDLPAYCWYPPRSRYRADSILLFQNRMDGKNYTMGVLSEDISVDAHGYEDWGVQGLGSRPGKNAVASTFRVKNKTLFYKVVIHEFLHNLGLDHCPQNDRSCYICDANKHPQLEKEVRLCPVCKAELQRILTELP